MAIRFRLKGQTIQLSENDVERACVELVGYRGYLPQRNHVGRFKTVDNRWITIGEAGTPDWTALKAPSFLFEVKRPGGKPSEEKLSEAQQRKIREIELAWRLPVAVVSSVEELAAWLQEHEKKFMPEKK